MMETQPHCGNSKWRIISFKEITILLILRIDPVKIIQIVKKKDKAIYVRNRFLQLVVDQEIDLTKSIRKRKSNNFKNNRKIVYLKCGKFGKFGRCLVKVFINKDDLEDKTKSVNKTLLNENLAYKYYGGTKNNDFTSYYKKN